ncbi:MAG: tRNA (N6-threonylcarbamoyladenosine(37)-N6)-methyltransferase TrmO [Bdellovibrionales bacterium]|nr:tRNA (N6-threonylcarbamoyladenosine(37)-N6)-methyltransferase TrmO [Bdellovibrionales bacterium]
MNSTNSLRQIAVIHSPYKEKFSIPRQPGLNRIESTIELIAPFNRTEALMGLENFSHLWVIFSFHETNPTDETSLVVRPPRLGGNVKQGVFATRSPFRPNNLGLSLVEIKKIEATNITVIGGDFLDLTPVYDLKPYLKEIEAPIHAKSGWTDQLEVVKLEVVFECDCTSVLKEKISEILALDPRPRFHEDGYKTYGTKIFDKDVHWHVFSNRIIVTNIISI